MTTSPADRLRAWRMNVTKNLPKWQQHAFKHEHNLVEADESEATLAVIQRYRNDLKDISADEMYRISMLDVKEQQEATTKWKEKKDAVSSLRDQLIMIEEVLKPFPVISSPKSRASSTLSEASTQYTELPNSAASTLSVYTGLSASEVSPQYSAPSVYSADSYTSGTPILRINKPSPTILATRGIDAPLSHRIPSIVVVNASLDPFPAQEVAIHENNPFLMDLQQLALTSNNSTVPPPIPTRRPNIAASVYSGETSSGHSTIKLFKEVPQTPAVNEAPEETRTPRIESKLPRITLPKFDGKAENFPAFIHTFMERIDSQQCSKQDKLFYLMQHVTGQAKAAIEGYSLIADNYDKCLNILKGEFGVTDTISYDIKEKLEKLPPPRDNLNSLLDFINNVCARLRRLEGLSDINHDDYIVRKIVTKLPTSWKQAYHNEFHYNTKPSFDDLHNFLRAQYRTVRDFEMTSEETRMTQGREHRKPPQNNFNQKKPWPPSAVSTPFPSFQKQNYKDVNSPNMIPVDKTTHYKQRTCFFCGNSGHATTNCSTVVSRKARIDALGDRCHKCFRTHPTNECPSFINCRKCNGPHNMALCNNTRTTNLAAISSPEEKKKRLLLTTTVAVKAPKRDKVSDAVVILDTGSQRTYITNEFASRLGLPNISTETLLINGFCGTSHAEQSRLVEYEVLTEKGNVPIMANTLKRIVSGTVDVPDKTGKTTKRNLDMLIGLDFFFDFIDAPKEEKEGITCVKSSIGDLYLIANENEDAVTHGMLATNGFDHHDNLGWTAEYGELLPVQTNEDLQTLKYFNETTTKNAERYTVSIPFKEDPSSLPSNFGLARGQLNGTLNRMLKNPQQLQEYDNIIQEQLKTGILEVAPPRVAGPLHYLPHHPITKQESVTTKTRIVINCSAKASKDDKSLNDCVHQGPDLLPHMTGILLRSRTHVFVIAADVEKAFHQIIIAEEDRDYVRILWIRDISKPLTNDNLIALRFARVLFGLKTSPFLLLAVLRKHLTQYYEGSDILKNLYVDNVFIFTDDIEAAIREKPKLKAALADAGMNLRCWFSNNLTIDANFTDDEKYAGEEKRILGIIFDCLKDCFVFNIEIADLGLQWTPARIMKAKLHVFDPLGFLLPVFVSVKLFIHNLVKGRHPLKKPLKPEDERSWRELLNNFKEKQVITVPRYTGQGTDFELHVFCDASSQFVAAAAYLRVKQADGSFRTSLLMAKNHVKDTLIPDADEQKIPKLELVALVVGSQLMQKITIEIDVTFARRYLWSDSQIALAWIKKCPELPFVARRLPEIIKLQCQYGYVQSQLNPADLPTRGCLPNVLQQHHQWWNGPEWLQNEEERWPNPTASMTQLDITEATILLATKNESQSFSSDPSSPSFIPDSSYSPLIDLYRLSTYSKAVSVARKVLQVTSKLLSFVNRKLCDYGTKNGRVTWKDACWLLLREEQKRYGQRLIVNSKVVLRDGVFLYVDRYDNARGVQTRLPVLPMESRLAALLALHIHVTMMHAGPPHTLANLRKQAWVIKGRKLVTELIHRCPTCKRHSAIPFHLPDYAQHPSERVNAFDAFKHVGLDYFGPMTLKSNDKRWGLILTCLSTRAIHLELVCDLTVISFVSALTRFTCRRRVPSVIYSDNATTFRATSRLFELHTNTFPNDPTALSFFETNQIDWRFITERSPWKGGVYERLIGVVKVSFKKTVGRETYDDDQLRTILTRLEAAANKRPLTYIDDSLSPLRPCDFLGQCEPNPLLIPDSCHDTDDESDPTWMPKGPAGREDLVKKLNLHNAHLQKCWKIWNDEYLNLLRDRQNVKSRNARSTTRRLPDIGEVVIIYDDQRPRQHWKLAIVKALIPSSDGIIRSAIVTTSNRRDKNRPLNHLFSLELTEAMP